MLTLTNTGAEHLSKEEEGQVIEILIHRTTVLERELLQRFLSNYKRMKERIKELEAENERLKNGSIGRIIKSSESINPA